MTDLTNERSPWWAKLGEKLITNVGIPTVLLLVVGYGLFRSLMYMEQKIVSPFWDAHVQQMRVLSKSQEKIGDSLETQTVILKEMNKKMDVPTKVLEAVQRVEKKIGDK